MRDRKRRTGYPTKVGLLLTLAGALSLSVVAGGPASADPTPTVTFDEPATATAEYGQGWIFNATAENTDFVVGPWSATAVVHGAPSAFAPGVSSYPDGPPQTKTFVSVYPPYELAPLGVGSYTIDVTVGNGDDYTTTTPAHLTVTTAKLGIELRVLSDVGNPDAAIVTARFTGRFVDEYASSFYVGSALSPEGTWKISLVDADGQTATERSIERQAGDDILATSFYWEDAEPNAKYTAKATFTPSGSSAANFDIAPANDFAFTAADEARPVPTSTATAAPPAPLPEVSDFSLPLWALVLGGVLIAGLAALVIVFIVKLRVSTSTPADGAANAAV